MKVLAEPSTMDKSRTRNIMIKFRKTEDIQMILQAPREKDEVSYKESRTGMASDLSVATHETGRQWNNAFIILRENYFQHKVSDQSKLLVKCRSK